MFRLFLKKPLFWIFLLALVLRLYKLETFPFGFHADEVRVAWNALSILKTGKDDRGNKLAFYYNTFGDYRPTGIFYFTAPALAIFGRNEFAVRFPTALLGALSVFPLYLLVQELDKKKNLALLAAAFLAISPWHIAVSRATSEVAMSAFFILWGLLFELKLIRKNQNKFLWASLLSFISGYFLYHSIRLVTPLFVGAVALTFWQQISKSEGLLKRVVALFGLIVLVSLLFSAAPEAKKRLSQVSIWKDVDINYELDRVSQEEKSPLRSIKLTLFHNKPFVYARRFFNEYSNYLSSNFLLVSVDARPYRYITPGVGLLTFVEFAFFALGLVQILKGKAARLPLWLLLISPIPAALTTEDAPNLHRAFYMILFIAIIEAYGFVSLLKTKVWSQKIAPAVVLLLILNFVYFLHMYFDHSFIHRPLYQTVDFDASSYRNVGAKELAIRLDQLRGKYNQIFVTNFPDDPYPWYAFFTGQDPAQFNQVAIKRIAGSWNWQNITFSQDRCPSDNYRFTIPDKTLLVDSWLCGVESKIKDGLEVRIDEIIQRPDGSPVYYLLEKK